MTSNNAETTYEIKTENGLPVAEVKFKGIVPLAVVADSIQEGRSLSLEELRMMQLIADSGMATGEPEFDLQRIPCVKDRAQCITCKVFRRVVKIKLPDGSEDLELYLCPQSGVKVKENIKLSYLAQLSPVAADKLEAWTKKRQEEGQAKAAAKEEASL